MTHAVPLRRHLGRGTDGGRHRHVVGYGRQFARVGDVFRRHDEHVHQTNRGGTTTPISA